MLFNRILEYIWISIMVQDFYCRSTTLELIR